jgi:trimethylamine--corrinoid protein Co-methyltransferase
MRLLHNVGVVVPVNGALEIFKKHGFRVDGQRVYADEGWLMRAISNAPAKFAIRARDPQRSVTVGGDRHVFAPGYGAPFIAEPDGMTRPATLRDYENLTRLADALPNLDLSGHMLVEPSDVPPKSAYLFTLRASMVHSSKPFMGSVYGVRGAQAGLEMAGILFGDQTTIRRHPVMVSLINVLSPLSFSVESIEALMEYARWRQPLIISSGANAGMSAPAAIAGTLVMANAEVLMGIALAQLIEPGTPVVYGATGSVADMRTGGITNGSPEAAIFIVCTGQVSRYYGLPSRSGGCLTDSHLPDAQAGLESMMTMLATVQSGIDFVLHTGGMLGSYITMSYEKLMVDSEICGMVRRFERGFGMEEDDLALNVMASVGPGGHFLAEPHTAQRCRTEFYQPRLANRKYLSNWQADGRPRTADKAREAWQNLLASHTAPLPDAGTLALLDRYVEARI